MPFLLNPPYNICIKKTSSEELLSKMELNAFAIHLEEDVGHSEDTKRKHL